MTAVSLIACVVVLWGLATRSKSAGATFLERLEPSAGAARLAAVALVPLYAAQLAIVAVESRMQSVTSPYAWMKTLPIPVFEHPHQGLPHEAWFASAAFALAILESVATGIVVLALRHRADALRTPFVLALACAFAALSLAAPAMSTTDPYEYAATGIRGLQAYVPSKGAYAGTVYAPYQQYITLGGGVIYGPLWVVIDTAQTALGSSLYAKIEAIRVTNVAFVALFVALLANARVPRAALVAVALNPCVWFYFVANPHADIEALVMLAAAYGFAVRSRTWPAVAFIVAAGLIKLPFAICGGALLVPLPGIVRRSGAWIASLVLVLVVSYLVPGPAYVADVTHFAQRGAAAFYSAGWLLVAMLIACASVALVLWRRAFVGAAWLFAQMVPLAFPQYVFWGVPYALATASFEAYAIALPLATCLLDEAARLEAAWELVFGTIVVLAVSDVYVTLRGRAKALSPSAP